MKGSEIINLQSMEIGDFAEALVHMDDSELIALLWPPEADAFTANQWAEIANNLASRLEEILDLDD